MKIQVLGCHGSDMILESQYSSQCCRSSGFLFNDHLLIDAGTAASALSLEAQRKIRHVLLSHIHLDHIKELPALADNLLGTGEATITVSSTPVILEELKQYVFNDHIYPNFFELPKGRTPILVELALQPGESTRIAEFDIIPIKVNHTVPTVGFIIQDDTAACLYSGDTYQTEEIWKMAATIPNLKAVLIETSFPDEMSELALASKHLTPSLLAQEFKKIGRPDLPLYIYHIKPTFRDQILTQLHRLNIPTLSVLEEGQEICLE